MSGLAIVALALAAAWLGGLTLLIILVIRQIGLLTVRLDQARTEVAYAPHVGPTVDTANDGPVIGSAVPGAVADAIPELAAGLTYLLLVASTCGPCRQLVADLQRRRFASKRPLVALVPGPVELADALSTMLPPGTRSIRDPEAATLAKQHLQIQSTPFALQIEEGIVTGKAYLNDADDLRRFIDSRATSDAGQIARRAKQAREVVSHVT